jgi:hypothetical protein
MSDVRWDLIAQYPNAGQGFADAFQGGMQRNALAALALNPNDPNAQSAAAPYAPGQVMQARQHQAELTQQELEAWTKYAGGLAKMAKTPAEARQAIDHLLSQNHPGVSTDELLAMKAMPDDQLMTVRKVFMAKAGMQDDAPQADPSSVREYQYARGQGFNGSYTDFLQYVHPPSPVTIPAGATVSSAPGGSDMPQISSPQEAAQLPPGTQFRMPDGRIGTVPGGASGNAGGGFPRPY